MEKNSSTPYFYLDSSIPTYVGKEPLRKTNLTIHQKRSLFYIRLLESEHPIPILSNKNSDNTDTQNLYFNTNYAFYADPICTGKSFVILSLLSLHRRVERKRLLTIWSNGLGMNVFSKIQNFEIPLSILVAPQTSLSQWDTLFKDETDIRYFIVETEEEIDRISIYDYDVLIVSDSIFDKICLHFEGFSVSRIIFDDLLHIEIKDIPKSSYLSSNGEPNLFGNLRSSFTWFVSSEPHACLQKYKNSKLPFTILIKQIFSFPHTGLIFKNEDTTLEQSLSVILPEIEIHHQNVYLRNIDIPNPPSNFDEQMSIQQEIQNIVHSKTNINHLITLLVKKIHMKVLNIDDIYQNLSPEKIQRLKERYEIFVDPVTYEKISYPIVLPCCHQIFDILSITKCLLSDMRCPFCRKETKWEDLIGLDISVFSKVNIDIWDIVQSIDTKKYNVIYIPSLRKDISINKDYRHRLNDFIKELAKKYKCFVFSGRTNSKKVFEQFKKEKGILIIAKPIQANLHLTYVDNVFVLHPVDYKCFNQKVWFTNYFKDYYSNLIPEWEDRSQISLTDHELGNFCIGKNSKLSIMFMSFI